jgi:glutaredoxin
VKQRLRVIPLVVAVLIGALVCGPGAGCKKKASPDPNGAVALPVVRPDSVGLLLTWIDDKGDFHVETRVDDVPLMGRDSVRVAEPDKETANPDQVFVADLRKQRPDGTYPVQLMNRAEFESSAVARRQQAGPTLAIPPPSASTPPEGTAGAAPAQPSARPAVVIYGAEWCGACHDAARYLRHKGIPYVEKDVEKDANAAREMQEKLAKNGLQGGSIPVIDVRGKIMVGFNASEIDAALGAPL